MSTRFFSDAEIKRLRSWPEELGRNELILFSDAARSHCAKCRHLAQSLPGALAAQRVIQAARLRAASVSSHTPCPPLVAQPAVARLFRADWILRRLVGLSSP
jgi:hypothetical protein